MTTETRTYATDLSCESCLSTVKPFLDGEPSIEKWKIDLVDTRKPVTVTAPVINEAKLRALFQAAGYELLGEITDSELLTPEAKKTRETSTSFLVTYAPLLLILGYLLVTLALIRPTNFMAAFMGGFFLIFSFFKFLNLPGFAQAYSTYDIVAKAFKPYGYAYPFIELALGLAFVSGFAPKLTSTLTVIVMTVSSFGVLQSLRNKQAIQCACLGTVFKLPMTKVTLFEDLLMVVMALYSLQG